MGVRPDAPTIETIVWVTFYEIIKIESSYLLSFFFLTPAEKWLIKIYNDLLFFGPFPGR